MKFYTKLYRNKNLKQQGFLLPAAIFLLVILAGLGAYAINLTTVQQATSTQDVQGTRAYHAARSGVEWAIYQIMQTSPDATTLPACPTSPTDVAINGFTVTVSCTAYGNYFEQDADHTIVIYQVTATAKMGTAGQLDYIERQIQMNISKCRGTDAAAAYACS